MDRCAVGDVCRGGASNAGDAVTDPPLKGAVDVGEGKLVVRLNVEGRCEAEDVVSRDNRWLCV